MTATDSKLRFLPWVVLGVAVVYLLSAVGRSGLPTEPYDLKTLAALPVVDGGRVKPLDTVARVYLRMISQKETVTHDGKEVPAIQWYLDVTTSGVQEERGRAWQYQVFRIENEELLGKLGLQVRDGLRYSLTELAPSIGKLQKWSDDATRRKKAGQQTDLSDAKVLELAERIELCMKLATGRVPMQLPPEGGREWEAVGDLREQAGREASQKVLREHGLLGNPHALQNLKEDELALLERERDKELKSRLDRLAQERPAAGAWLDLTAAYRKNDPAAFNAGVRDYRAKFYGEVPANDLTRSQVEMAYNRLAPFYYCIVLYVLVLLCCVASWLGAPEQWRRSAFLLLYLTVIIHTAALITRMYVLDRWFVFVTNLYSSAIFIGWGCVVLGLVLEWIFKIGVGNLVAAVLGVLTTIISHNMATGGDTLEMMQAVLDTNFWLATHVTTITLGYTATLVAGFIGVALIARMLATVLVESFKGSGRPTTGHLVAFSFAATGLVAIPLMLAATGLKAASDFEKIPEFAFHILLFGLVAAGVVYAVALIALRGANEGVDSHGNPVAGQVPPLARVIEPLALDAEAGKKLGQMIYGVICFATLLSFVGTVLGGIWADQSWGRFWGWDPKENGAILLVLWNALILHARWAGLIRDRGMAVLAVAGNIITAWSWFGTNQLGIGLHAYGFDTRLAVGCRWFWLSQLTIIGLGLIPQRYWASALKRRFPAAPAAPAPAATQTAAPDGPGAPPPVADHANGHANGNGHAPKGGKGKKAGKRR